MTKSELRHLILYINRNTESEKICLTNEDYVKLRESLDKLKKAKSKTKRADWTIGSWREMKKGTDQYAHYVLNVHPAEGIYKTYYTKMSDDERNRMTIMMGGNPGTMAYKAVRDEFIKKYNTTFKKAFDTTESEFRDCVPKQFYYINNRYCKRMVKASAIDFCAQYPTNLCGTLPDGHERLILKGRIKPSEAYPFAFYVKSRCVAEFEKYDTHDWIDSRFAYNLLCQDQIKAIYNTKDEDEITVLMKSSKFEFNDIMDYFYEVRKKDPIAKIVMNAFIGMLHTKKYVNHKYAHLAAISIARSNEKMRALAEDELKEPIHICVDGCVYLDKIKIGTDSKGIGLCHQEFIDKLFYMEQMNCYAVMNDDESIIKFRHGAFNSRTDGKNIEELNSIAEMKFWAKENILKGDEYDD